MPDYFSHSICAQKILDACPIDVKKRITDSTLYMIGAQGGDVFFTYKLSFQKTNLGRKLHRLNTLELFEKLCEGNRSYACGFATHYALDCTLHPAIYAYENGVKSPLAHMRFESDLGLFISRKFSVPRSILPEERLLSSTFSLYDSIKRIQPRITVTGVERCLKRHFSYTRALLRSKKQEYGCNYDFHSLSGAVDDAISLGTECVESVLSGSPSKELFSRSFLEK